jgi:hypothetical protein
VPDGCIILSLLHFVFFAAPRQAQARQQVYARRSEVESGRKSYRRPAEHSLIRRGPAPRLGALKNRTRHDTVRSVLDQFTGGRAKPATLDEAAPAPANAPAAMGDVK